MEKQQHTPGPWAQGTSNTGRSCVWIDGHVEPEKTMGPDNTWIDCCTEANARLIAAAPDLLGALEEIVSAADGDGWSQIDADLRKARAAIAKAKGG